MSCFGLAKRCLFGPWVVQGSLNDTHFEAIKQLQMYGTLEGFPLNSSLFKLGYLMTPVTCCLVVSLRVCYGSSTKEVLQDSCGCQGQAESS